MAAIAARSDALLDLLNDPRDLVERRVERLALSSSNRYQWEVRQQIRIPDIDIGDLASSRFVVSLGMYEKRRLADLVASAPGQSELSILSRDHRGELLAVTLLGRYWDEVGFTLNDETITGADVYSAKQPFEGATMEAFTAVQTRVVEDVVKIIVSDIETAQDTFDALVDDMRRDEADGGWPRLLEPLACPAGEIPVQFEEQIRPFIKTTHVLAEVEATPNLAITVKIVFSDEVKYLASNRPTFSLDVSNRDLQAVGLVPRVLHRPCHNADHCKSYYLIVEPPDGIEVVRMYWEDVEVSRTKQNSGPPDAGDTYYAAMHEGHGGVIAMHNDDHESPEFPAEAFVELRMRNDSWIRVAWTQAAVLVLLCAMIRLRVVDGGISNIGLVFAFPAGVSGLISLRTGSFIAHISSWVRRSYLLIAACSSAFALGFSVRPHRLPVIGDWPLLTLFNTMAGGIAAFIAAVTLGLAFWPVRAQDEPASSSLTRSDIKEWIARGLRRARFQLGSATVLGLGFATWLASDLWL